MRLLLTLSALAVLVLPASAVSQSQSNPNPITTYQFNVSVPVYDCDFAGQNLSSTPKFPPAGAKFYYLDEVPGPGIPPRPVQVIIEFLSWSDSTLKQTFNVLSSEEARERKGSAGAGDPRFFCISKPLFDRAASRIYKAGLGSVDLAVGALVMPIKMRGINRPFDFSKDLTIGTVAGPRFRLNNQRDLYGSLLVGAGITAVTLTPENTHNAVDKATDRAALTLTFGPMLEVNRFQFGVMFGWDRISNPNQSNWIYQGRPWLSLGLGYSLLSAPPATPASGGQK
ncbi:MAG TPA: hypothetical protein VFE05_04025 [Longimicrobiaceae bacterium]|jgi:hypothetical protein|nr:hypothetical protein [Longimicrobiaceae bacterium]